MPVYDVWRRHGRGVYRCARSAVRYEGDWVHGLRQGHGVIEFSGSACEPGGCVASYDGNWQHNRKNGRGRFQYASGNVYDGDWLDDVKHGHGRMHWRALHEVYVGNWHNGQPHGQVRRCLHCTHDRHHTQQLLSS
eukprot:TRINITY_DN1857_c0_g4_i1.p1 TRINITY_DN1857_c0_g4~~TRINITY_DN1857_c0_g4_i1.p1  ORF type:complete len:135 (+),score=26.12 TRINITY_DN1857_c0_g4_i1:442-846(+)